MFVVTNLESSSETENTVICLLGRQSLERKLNNVILFGNQIVRSVSVGK